jgi:hypothetical protein
MVHASQQFTPPQLLEAGHRAEVEGKFDLAIQFYRHLTEHYAFTGEAAEARNGLGRVGAAQSQIWQANGSSLGNGATTGPRRRPVAPRDHYRTGRALAQVISAVGWVTVLTSLAGPALYLALDGITPVAALPRFGILQILMAAGGLAGTGLFTVFTGQIARAVFDQANATRDLIALERAKLGSD